MTLHKEKLGGVVPNGLYGRADTGVDLGACAGFGRIFHDKIAVLSGVLVHRLNFELLHSADNGFGAFDEILENGGTVVEEFIMAVTLKMDDLHLLDNG